MSKPSKSQWDFGELFPRETTRQVFSVGELTGKIRKLLEAQIGQVWVTGEVTNLRGQAVRDSGHLYFAIKDAGSQLNCVLFRGEALHERPLLIDGAKVVLQGQLTVYEPRGQYQLIVTAVELQGVGALQIAFEKLKLKLQSEGLFAPGRKRTLPRFPQQIGLVTSPTGAALRDVLHVIQRRNPGLKIIFVPCRVQGDGASGEISRAIGLLNEFAVKQPLDLILLTRGGGSLEDLWAFNEEGVARAIFESAVPVVSAVGHELDFTISDFVADVRAATPSAAAEIVTEGVFSSGRFISEIADWMRQRVRQRFDREQRYFQQAVQRLGRAHPRSRLNDRMQLLDELSGAMRRDLKNHLRVRREAWRNLRLRLGRLKPRQLLAQRRELLEQERSRLGEAGRHRLQELKNRCVQLGTQLRLLSPEQILSRGYSITMDEASGKVLRAAEEVRGGQKLRTRLKSGHVRSVAENP